MKEYVKQVQYVEPQEDHLSSSAISFVTVQLRL